MAEQSRKWSSGIRPEREQVTRHKSLIYQVHTFFFPACKCLTQFKQENLGESNAIISEMKSISVLNGNMANEVCGLWESDKNQCQECFYFLLSSEAFLSSNCLHNIHLWLLLGDKLHFL